MKSKCILINKTGGSNVLKYTNVELNELGSNDVLIKHKAIGVNYIDIYHRSGVNPVDLPFIPGLEGSGEVIEVGVDVKEFFVGDRVAYCTAMSGGYSEYRTIDVNLLIKVPSFISFDNIAAILLKGLTAEYLVHRAYRVTHGDIVLVHAAAGGVGTILCQWLKVLGATVIGTVGSDFKSEYAKKHGCDYTINYKTEDVVNAVKDITSNTGVAVVYDSVGKDTLNSSIKCLSPFGYLIGYGNASGIPDPIPPMTLAQHGSLFYTRPRLADYCFKREDLLRSADSLFKFYNNNLQVEIGNIFHLKNAKDAHDAISKRTTLGSTILLTS